MTAIRRKTARNGLADLPAVLELLRRQGARVRIRIEELGEGEHAAAARHDAERHLADSVTALEAIRLQLSRLTEGIGTLESITDELAAGMEVADYKSLTQRIAFLAGKSVQGVVNGQRASPPPGRRCLLHKNRDLTQLERQGDKNQKDAA